MASKQTLISRIIDRGLKRFDPKSTAKGNEFVDGRRVPVRMAILAKKRSLNGK